MFIYGSRLFSRILLFICIYLMLISLTFLQNYEIIYFILGNPGTSADYIPVQRLVQSVKHVSKLFCMIYFSNIQIYRGVSRIFSLRADSIFRRDRNIFTRGRISPEVDKHIFLPHPPLSPYKWNIYYMVYIF